MANRDRKLNPRFNANRLIAMAFLVVLFAEWGSHSLAFSHAYSSDGQAQAVVDYNERGHEDPCKTMVHGSDGTRQERPVPKVGHDITQARSFFGLSVESRNIDPQKDPRIPRSSVSGLSRTVSPPFHPPELS